MQHHQLPITLEICGGIASGKTTLANLVSRIGIAPILEDFQSNPFWKAFYADPSGNAFEAEVTFLLQHYHDIKSAAPRAAPVAFDFSPYLDLAYSRVTLPERRRGVFDAVYREVRSELGPPSLLIHLKCEPLIELERIRRRGRSAESSISVAYLKEISSQLDELLHQGEHRGSVLVIDSGTRDFASDEEGKRATLQEIEAALVGPSTLSAGGPASIG